MPLIRNLEKCLLEYRSWIKTNPKRGEILESCFKLLSYYFSGRNFKHISAVSELFWSLHRVLSLTHRLLVCSKVAPLRLPAIVGARLRVVLTFVEYIQLFLELVLPARASFLVVFLLQLIRTSCQLVLLHVDSCGILSSRSLQLHEIESAPVDAGAGDGDLTAVGTCLQEAHGHKLPSSGRVIRSFYSAQTAEDSGFQGLPHTALSASNQRSHALSSRHLTAETLYQLRPLCHLVVVALTKRGNAGWPAWLLPLALELISLHLMSDLDARLLSPVERQCLLDRRAALQLYLLRSPVYERFVERPLSYTLRGVGSVLPWGSRISSALLDYIDTWRSLHFTSWS